MGGCGRVGFPALVGDAAMTDSARDAHDGAPVDAAVDAATDAGDARVDATSDADAATPRCGPVEVYVGLESEDASLLRRFAYDPDAPVASRLTRIDDHVITDIGDLPVGHGIRSIAPMADGRIVVSDVSRSLVAAVDPVSGASEAIALGDPALLNSHGACGLADGSLIVGEFAGMGVDGARIHQYEATGSFVRSVATAVISRGALSGCWAEDDGRTLFYVEGDTTGLENGEVVRTELVDGAWTETSRFRMSDFDAGAGTAVWSMLLHTDGSVVIAPCNWTADSARVSRLVRCPSGDLDAAGCSVFGEEIPEGGTRPWVHGLGQLPCSDDILVLTGTSLYLLEMETGTYTLLIDGFGAFHATRKLVVRVGG